MKLICPRCMKPVTLPDDFAGREVTCPSCQNPFDAPAKYTPAVISEPTASPAPPTPPRLPEPSAMSPEVPPSAAPSAPPLPPPGLVPTPPPVPSVPVAAPLPLPLPVGYAHARGATVSPKVIAWMPAVLLTITFLCTFFPWVGSYLGGYPVFSQNGWQAMFGYPSRNLDLIEKAGVPQEWQGKLRGDWELLVPAFLALIFAVCLAWADRGFHSLDPRKVPPLAGIWAWRRPAIVVLAGLAFLFIATQAARGFGMERAIRQTIRENPALAKEREEAAGVDWKLAIIENKEDQELAKYNLERTIWLSLALTCNLLALLTMLGHVALERRGDKPPPRFVVQY